MGTSAPPAFKLLCQKETLVSFGRRDFMCRCVGWRSGSVPWNGISSWVRKPCVRLQTKDGWKFYETDVPPGIQYLDLKLIEAYNKN